MKVSCCRPIRDNVRAPAKLLTGLNEVLCGNTLGQYVTAAYVYLDAQTREFRYAAAGHPAMLLMRGDRVISISENGMLLGATSDSTYTQCSLP
jgi:phosphoserine phosphatase RsbU/P